MKLDTQDGTFEIFHDKGMALQNITGWKVNFSPPPQFMVIYFGNNHSVTVHRDEEMTKRFPGGGDSMISPDECRSEPRGAQLRRVEELQDALIQLAKERDHWHAQVEKAVAIADQLSVEYTGAGVQIYPNEIAFRKALTACLEGPASPKENIP